MENLLSYRIYKKRRFQFVREISVTISFLQLLATGKDRVNFNIYESSAEKSVLYKIQKYLWNEIYVTFIKYIKSKIENSKIKVQKSLQLNKGFHYNSNFVLLRSLFGSIQHESKLTQRSGQSLNYIRLFGSRLQILKSYVWLVVVKNAFERLN